MFHNGFVLFLLEKVGFDSIIWKNIEKGILNVIILLYFHEFKNILKYMYFFTSQIIIS